MPTYFARILLIASLLFIGDSARAELSAVAHLLSLGAVGIINGRPTVDPKDVDPAVPGTSHPDLPWVKVHGEEFSTPPYMTFIRNSENGVGGNCSGMVIDGCVLTGGHCLHPGHQNDLFFGGKINMAGRGNPGAVGSKFIKYGLAKNPPEIHDLGVIKIKGALPAGAVSLPRSVLAESDPAAKDQVTIAGYGVSESRWDDLKRKYVNFGEGTLRVGTAEVVASGGTPGEPGLSYRPGEGLIYGKKDPNAPAPADSGSGMWKDKKLTGVFSVSELPGDKIFEHAKSFAYTSVAYNRQWILDALMDLDCGKFSKAEMGKRIARWLDARLHRGKVAQEWKALSPGDREVLSGLMGRYLNFPEGDRTKVEITGIDDKGGKATIQATSEDGTVKAFDASLPGITGFIPRIYDSIGDGVPAAPKSDVPGTIRYNTLPRPKSEN